MKQILQNLSNGETSLVEVPCPKNIDGNLLIATRCSVVSIGTERMLVEFGKANLVEKARQQPDKVKQVLNKVKTDGLIATIDSVRSKLDQPVPLGYCNAGVVLESGVENFKRGDRVVSNGNHAEVVRVPKNLCARIPDGVDDESAAFTILGAIGLQGIRLLSPTLGETIVVFGLGLIGLMCVQILKANGCRVLGVDFDSKRCEMARYFGADTVDLSAGQNPISSALVFSRGRGVDGVLITAATKSDDVMHQSAEMCRKRGRIVLVGVVGLNLRRDDFFKKELSFQVSSSYGPGRYDPLYEEKGQDYPIGFVRWTEQRNFEAVLDMMANGHLNIKPLITNRFKIDGALEAYKLLSDSSALGIVLEYPPRIEKELRNEEVRFNDYNKGVRNIEPESSSTEPVVGFIGAGNYASRTLIPAFQNAKAQLHTVTTSSGISSVHHGVKAGFNIASTDAESLLNNQAINTVAIVTRHNSHASQVISALKARKHVFVEKPLALNHEDLKEIDAVYSRLIAEDRAPILMVGFNRRFAPLVVKMKSLLNSRSEPKSFIMTVNAGAIPADHWVQDPEIGGGRIIGEVCHFIDLMRFLVGHSITKFQAMTIGNVPEIDIKTDKISINFAFADGSFGTVHYLANGGKAFPKERVEVFCGDSVLQLNNYRNLYGFNWPGFRKQKLFRLDKGQTNCVGKFINAVRNGYPSPISYDEIMESSRVAIDVAASVK